jgi:hypothetical protein
MLSACVSQRRERLGPRVAVGVGGCGCGCAGRAVVGALVVDGMYPCDQDSVGAVDGVALGGVQWQRGVVGWRGAVGRLWIVGRPTVAGVVGIVGWVREVDWHSSPPRVGTPISDTSHFGLRLWGTFGSSPADRMKHGLERPPAHMGWTCCP